MAKTLIYYFALTIFLVNCDNNGEYYDTIHSSDLEYLKDKAAKGDKQEFKESLAGYMTKQISYIRMRMIERGFLTHFECAVIGWKPVLEDIYKKWCPNTDLAPLADKQAPEIPEDIVNLNTTYDQWFDDYQVKSIPSRKKWNGSRRVVKPFIIHTRANLFKFYKNWYILITSDSAVPFVKELREKLSKHKENFPDFYKDKDIQVRFAACIARSFLLVCTTCHRVMQDLREHFKVHSRDNFADILFELVPYWHLSEETIVYINILRSTLSSAESESLGKCIKGDISCFPTRNKKDDDVCLPYLFSKECGRVDLMRHLTGYSFSFVTESNYTSLF